MDIDTGMGFVGNYIGYNMDFDCMTFSFSLLSPEHFDYCCLLCCCCLIFSCI